MDQMRESSTEKDLKRLLGNVALQLDAIKRGYQTFQDAQLEIVKKYPEMVSQELAQYENSVRRFFMTDPEASSSSSFLDIAGPAATNSELGLGTLGSIKQVLTERLSSEAESKLVSGGSGDKTANKTTITGGVTIVPPQTDLNNNNPEDIVENMLDAQSNGFKPELIERVNAEGYLRNCFIESEFFVEIRSL